MQGTTFAADMFMIPLESIEMVLGVHWLATLGDILWNFNSLTMKFLYHGTQVTLQGNDFNSVTTISAASLQRILNNTSNSRQHLLQLFFVTAHSNNYSQAITEVQCPEL